jgi:hypothetical protein
MPFMAFGLWFPLTLFFAAAVFGLLESATAWSLQYRWLIPRLAAACGLSQIFYAPFYKVVRAASSLFTRHLPKPLRRNSSA